MISEAVSVRLPVIGVSPARHAFKPEEADYRELMRSRSWCRFLPIAALDVASFDAALAAIVPMTANLADALADQIIARLPQLVEHATGRPLSATPFLRYLERKYAAIYA